jgi:hypothetical protein
MPVHPSRPIRQTTMASPSSITSIPRFLLPRGPGVSPLTLRYTLLRHASFKSSSNKPKVLEKPSRFNPPSHPSRYVPTSKGRAPIIPRQYPGPPVSPEEKEAQQTRKYPNMFPPKGSFMHWFLTNKAVHIWITLVCCFMTCYAFNWLYMRELANYVACIWCSHPCCNLDFLTRSIDSPFSSPSASFLSSKISTKPHLLLETSPHPAHF